MIKKLFVAGAFMLASVSAGIAGEAFSGPYVGIEGTHVVAGQNVPSAFVGYRLEAPSGIVLGTELGYSNDSGVSQTFGTGQLGYAMGNVLGYTYVTEQFGSAPDSYGVGVDYKIPNTNFLVGMKYGKVTTVGDVLSARVAFAF